MFQPSHHTHKWRVGCSAQKGTPLQQQSCYFCPQIATLPQLIQKTQLRLKNQEDANNIYDVLDLNSSQQSIRDLVEELTINKGHNETSIRNFILSDLLQKARKRQVSWLNSLRNRLLHSLNQAHSKFEGIEGFRRSCENFNLLIFGLQVIQSLLHYIQLNQSQSQLTEALEKCGISKSKAKKQSRTLRLNIVKSLQGEI